MLPRLAKSADAQTDEAAGGQKSIRWRLMTLTLSGQLYRVFEGTVLEGVVTNHIDGGLAGRS